MDHSCLQRQWVCKDSALFNYTDIGKTGPSDCNLKSGKSWIGNKM